MKIRLTPLLGWFASASCCLRLISPCDATGAELRTRMPSDSTPAVTANGDSTGPIISADGRFIFFMSTADNLVTNDANGALLDVFVRERASGITRLVSVATNGLSGRGHSILGSVSSNGQFVAFVSAASDLAPGDTNGVDDVFLRDLVLNQTWLISTAATDSASGNGPSQNATLTPDGRLVVFESEADNLVAQDTNRVNDVFRRDWRAGETVLVSAPNSNPTLARAASGPSRGPTMSPDGNLVAFVSDARNLAESIDGKVSLVYVRNIAMGQTRMVDVFSAATTNARAAGKLMMSETGSSLTCVAELSFAPPARGGGVYRIPLDTLKGELAAPTLNTTNSRPERIGVGPFISRDSERIILEARSGPRGTNFMFSIVYAVGLSPGQPVIVSSNVVGGTPILYPDPFGSLVGASADGKRVAFLSPTTNWLASPEVPPLQLFVRDLDTGEARRVSRDRLGQPTRQNDLAAVSFDADGRFMAFASSANDLIADDRNQALDVFLYNWETDTVELVSKRLESAPSWTSAGMSYVAPGCLSADGRYLVFVSDAPGLVAADRNGCSDVFVQDLQTGTNVLVSFNADGSSSGNGPSLDPVISADGRYVAFTSSSSDLVAGDRNHASDVFVRDLLAGNTILASRSEQTGLSGNRSSNRPTITADGSRVAFESEATDLVASLTIVGSPPIQIYLFESVDQKIRLVSRDTSGQPGNQASRRAQFSPDGRWIVFLSEAQDLVSPDAGVLPLRHTFAYSVLSNEVRLLTPNIAGLAAHQPNWERAVFSADGRWALYGEHRSLPLATPEIFRTDLTTGQTKSLTDNGAMPSVSADGRLAAWKSVVRTMTDSHYRIQARDLETGQEEVVSVGPDGSETENDSAFDPQVSADGRFVTFLSRATNLHPKATNGHAQLFVRDLTTKTTLLLSVGTDGEPANAPMLDPIFAPDNRTIVFNSRATNLASDDRNRRLDVFVVRFEAGPEPLRIWSIRRLTTGDITLAWPAIENGRYQVEFKNDLTDRAWQPLAASPNIAGNQAVATDKQPVNPHRFYRVRELAAP